MKLASIAVLLATVAMAAADRPPVLDVSQADSIFEKFVKDFNRQYKDDEDRKIHFEAFKKNLHEINKLNAQNTPATFGITEFTDYTDAEYAQMHGLRTD